MRHVSATNLSHVRFTILSRKRATLFPLHATIMDIEIMLMSGDGMCNSVSVETSDILFTLYLHKHYL